MSLKRKVGKLRRTLKKSNKIDTYFKDNTKNIDKKNMPGKKLCKKPGKKLSDAGFLKNLKKFQKQGISFLTDLSENKISTLIKQTDIHYYKHNISLINDEQYDILKQFALSKFPNNEIGFLFCSLFSFFDNS